MSSPCVCRQPSNAETWNALGHCLKEVCCALPRTSLAVDSTAFLCTPCCLIKHI